MQRCKNPNGFVILIVLIFMQVLILLNWYGIKNILLLNRFSKNISVHDKLFENAQNSLKQVEANLILGMPDCVISFMEPSQIVSEPLSFWQAKSCSGNFQMFKYYYVVEPLPIDLCAIVDQVKNTSAAYFRITLLLYSNNDDARIYLQSTFVKPNVLLTPCKTLQHNVQMGRQSWRELDY